MEVAPDTVLMLVKASPDVIRRRMAENPHENGLVKDEDVERVLEAFQEQYDESFIRKKFDIDTSEATVEESLSEFLEKLQPHLSDSDRLWIMSGKGHAVASATRLTRRQIELIALDADLPPADTHLGGVVPGLHAQQHVMCR